MKIIFKFRFLIILLGLMVITIIAVQKTKQSMSVEQDTYKKSSYRKLSSADSDDFSELEKEEILGKDYGTPPDLTEVKEEINSHLKKIANLCQQKSLQSQLNQLEQSLTVLREIIPPNLEKRHLDVRDSVFLRRVFHILAREGILTSEKELTVQAFKSGKLNLAANFLDHYRLRYKKLEEEGELKFYQKWAEDVYKGLQCITDSNSDVDI